MASPQPLAKSAPSSAPTSSLSSRSTRRTRHELVRTPSSSAALSPSSRASWHSSSYPRSAKTRSKRRTSSSESIWSATATTRVRWARGRCWIPARLAARRRWGKRGRLFELCFVYVVQAVRLGVHSDTAVYPTYSKASAESGFVPCRVRVYMPGNGDSSHPCLWER